MNVITQSDGRFLNYLGAQVRKKGRKYRLNKYCIIQNYEDDILIANTMFGGLVSLKDYEFENIYTTDPCDYVDFLVSNYYIVPENFNEDEICEAYFKSAQKPFTPNYLDNPSSFTILSTTLCNARCPYCYELSAKGKTHMTKETAAKVAKYIIEHCDKRKPIHIGWFGGEPLYNQDVIDLICSRVRSAGIQFTGSIISNGYLFDEKTVNKASSLWNIKSAQITIDGVNEKYNETKRYIYKDDPNPFQTVINNVHNLIKHSIGVSIRMNCNNENAENLKELAKYLCKEFKDSNFISAYVWEIFEEVEAHKRTEEYNKQMYANMKEINQILSDGGILLDRDIHGVRLHHCLVDSESGVTISPNGDLGLCEHYINSKFIGHVDNPLNLNFDNIKVWRDFIKKEGICDSCILKAQCLKVTGCPDARRCGEAERDYQISKTKLEILNNYKDFIKNGPRKEPKQCNLKNCNKHGHN